MSATTLFADAKTYSKEDIDNLYEYVNTAVNKNNTVGLEYGLAAKVGQYEVYSSLDGTDAKVVYDVEFMKENFKVYASLNTQNVNGAKPISDKQKQIISSGDYIWYWDMNNLDGAELTPVPELTGVVKPTEEPEEDTEQYKDTYDPPEGDYVTPVITEIATTEDDNGAR